MSNTASCTVAWAWACAPDNLFLAQSMDETNPSFGGSNTSVLLFALGILLMLSILTRQLFRAYRRSRRKSPHKTVKQVREETAKLDPRRQTPLVDAPAAYARWHAELHDVVRDAQAEIDTKIRVLQSTMRLADQTAQQLRATVAEARAVIESAERTDPLPGTNPSSDAVTIESPTEAKPPESSSSSSPLRRDDPTTKVTRQLRTQTEKTLRIADQLQVHTQDADSHEGKTNDAQSNGLRLYPDDVSEDRPPAIQAQVRDLAERGLSAAAIAQETGIPHGDIDLYLSTLPFAPRANPGTSSD